MELNDVNRLRDKYYKERIDGNKVNVEAEMKNNIFKKEAERLADEQKEARIERITGLVG